MKLFQNRTAPPRTFKPRIFPLIGEKFGKLTVIGVSGITSPRKGNGASFGKIVFLSNWLCRCDCGNIVHAVPCSLKSGATTNCGCARKRRMSYEESSFREWYRTYTNNAKQRGLTFSLDTEQFRRIASADCFYCGAQPIKHYCSRRNEISGDIPYCGNGIDRFNNRAGYSNENCVACCETCNKMKLTMQGEDFIAHIKRIASLIHGKTYEKFKSRS